MTVDLIRLLESSDILSTGETSDATLDQLYRYSLKNRMPTCFLERIAHSDRHKRFTELLVRDKTAYSEMLDAVSRVSTCLRNAGIEHALFKTIRPYPSTTVDIDSIIFGNIRNYRDALRTMKDADYPMLAEGPMSATFWDPIAKIGIDIYNEIAVSALCYIDKGKFARFSSQIRLADNKNANLLAPEADLLAIVAHSIIKEQMYTLSEYYSFINYLEKMETSTFVNLVKETNLTNAAKTHASITALLFQATHGQTPKKLLDILEAVGRDNFETNRILVHDLETPHKYHPMTIARSLLEITKGKKPRTSIALQIYKMMNPTFTGEFLKALFQHFIRETY